MVTLQELRQAKKTLEESGIPVSPELLQKISDLEAELLKPLPLMAVNAMPLHTGAMDVEGSFTVLVEYRDNSLYGASVAQRLSAEEHGRFFIPAEGNRTGQVDPDTESTVEEPEPLQPPYPGTRPPSIGFSVRFADGTVFEGGSAKEVMIRALRKMGLDNASRYRGMLFNGDPLVGTRPRFSKKGKPYREEVDNWWIQVALSNDKKRKCLLAIADMLGYAIDIVSEEPTQGPTGPSGGDNETTTRPTYTLNGSGPLSKGGAVLGAITQLLKDIPSTTYRELCDIFPHDLQGNYGVMETLSQIDRRAQNGQDVSKRYFLKPGQTLTSADGIMFAVCTQWDYHNFPKVQEIIRDTLTYTLDEMPSGNEH